MGKVTPESDPHPMAAPPPYGAPPPGFYPTGPHHPGAIPPVQIQAINVVPLGPHSAHMTCPQCHAEISTHTETEAGTRAYVASGILVLFGCWLGCCLIPCCMADCMDVNHTCPSCRAYLGRYKR